MLKFSYQNTKLVKLAKMLGLNKKQVMSFDLPAGFTCPAADKCKAFANRYTGKLTDGKGAQFRCYAASSESAFTPVRALRWHNFELLKSLSLEAMVELILNSIPDTVKVLRVHSSGDFFTKVYFDAWVRVASARPDITFFGYTKILPYVRAAKPDNFHLVYSMGGKMDDFVTDEPFSRVVNSIQDAVNLGLPVSCQDEPADDYNYVVNGLSFALVLHGTQPAKSRRK